MSKENPVLRENVRKWSDTVNLDYTSDYAQWFLCFQKSVLKNGIVPTDEEILKPFLASIGDEANMKWPDDYPKDTDSRNLDSLYMEYTNSATRKMAFFTTTKGCLGLGPQKVEDGDLVCIIFGCAHPLLLRRQKPEAHYLLIGEAYIFRMMQSEITVELEAGTTRNLKAETFILS
jgi:hypothetical protein